MSKIIVMGSVSVDNVTYTKQLPNPGTTVFGEQFLSNVGGKGANQACASMFLGGDVFFLGSIGKDDNGNHVFDFLRSQGLKGKIKRSSEPTGVASITLDTNSGENRIIIVPGANLDILESDVLSLDEEMKMAQIFLCQLENPVKTVCFALKQAKKHQLITVLNPAPYHALPEDIYPYIDFFVPNEHELDGFVPDASLSFEAKAKVLLNKGVKNVIVTLGEKGSLLVNEKGSCNVDPVHVEAVDTTAAGDSYLGAFVTSLSNGLSVAEAMVYASKCSSMTVTRKGAIASLPKLEEIK